LHPLSGGTVKRWLWIDRGEVLNPPPLAQVAAHMREPAKPAPRPPDKPLLEAWPKGYKHGSFRLDGEDVLLFAKGRSTLRLKGSATP
jgi:hypothetical protein